MPKSISSIQKSYLAGFLDADGSIYVQAKPNDTYRFGYQIASYIVFYQSAQDAQNFSQISNLIGCGYQRKRKDGIIEHIIGKQDEIIYFLKLVKPFLLMKKAQADLMEKIII